MVRHIWIITGGRVDVDWLRSLSLDQTEENIIVAADKGLLYADQAEMPVQYILGDFDSLPPEILTKYRNSGVPIETFPPEKDYTDTHLALLWAMEQGAEKITIIGGLGSRFDHSFANVGLLSMLLSHGIQGEILDPHNRIFMMDKAHSGSLRMKKNHKEKEFISLIPYTEKVTGITLTGFKYPLQNGTLTLGISLGISNELVEEEGMIQMEDGILIVSVSRD